MYEIIISIHEKQGRSQKTNVQAVWISRMFPLIFAFVGYYNRNGVIFGVELVKPPTMARRHKV